MRFLIATFLVLAATLVNCDEPSFAGIPLADLPDAGNEPAMARFVVNNANWTSFGYVSKKCGGGNNACPGNAVFATSDGNVGCGSGIPYFWGSRHHPTIVELLDNDPRGALAMTLAQTNICKERGWDPQDPRCAHIVMYGNFAPLNEKDPEHAVAKKALLTRHPQLSYYPPGHKFFYAKLNITGISIISKFGGPVEIDLKEYFKIKC